MIIKEIKTELNSFEIFLLFKDEPYIFFLDSGKDKKTLGRYSIIGFDPFKIFKSKDKTITIQEANGIEKYTGDPFEELKRLVKKYKKSYKTKLPFVGGLVGYFGYDLCHCIEQLPRTAVDDINISDCILGFYNGAIVIDHLENKTYITNIEIDSDAIAATEKIYERIKQATKDDLILNLNYRTTANDFESNFKKDNYIKALKSIKNYIKSGDIYQANMTQRFTTDLKDTPIELYAKLRKINPAPFASYIDFKEAQIVSSSPERFIKVKNRMIETRPIKGTMPRGKTLAEDVDNKTKLKNSEKDKSELLMIVDLERNDLSKVSKVGSVEVTELFKLEEYATVFHLVSTIVGELRDDVDSIDCIKATFPGGSITGAPKIRAMEVIDELEPTQRNIYTGSIGYIGFNGDLDLNIVIRTILCKEDKAYFQVGGGIVWDSDEESEYQETLDKAKALMEALRY